MAEITSEEVFSNLDVFCEWDGNPDVPVDITVNIEVSKVEILLATV